MNDRFSEKAARLSDVELLQRLEIRNKQVPEATEAWLAELQNRGHVFTDEELTAIRSDIESNREKAFVQNSDFEKKDYKSVIVEDLDAPLFYPRRTIGYFSWFCGPLFASILLAINLGKIKYRTGVILTLAFGVAFTALQIVITDALSLTRSAAILWGAGGAVIIDYVLWKRFIGDGTLYRARPIWVPLIIAIVLGAFILWGTIISLQNHA